MQIPPKTKPRIFLIDAYALIYRSYYAFISRPLTNSAGENTSAPFGFTRFLLDIRRDFEPDYIAIVFDSGDSFRDEIYPEYKETREKMPDDLRASLKHIRTIVEGFNDPVVELEGYEADDVIGTLALQARDAGLEAVIVSGDKDFYQLVQPGIHLMNPGRGGAQGVAAEWVTEDNADEKFGIPPRQVADYLALVGDSSDNVPGARGIGPKTAVKLLAEHPDIETLLEHVDDVSPTRAQNSLRDNADEGRLSKRLGGLRAAPRPRTTGRATDMGPPGRYRTKTEHRILSGSGAGGTRGAGGEGAATESVRRQGHPAARRPCAYSESFRQMAQTTAASTRNEAAVNQAVRTT